MSGPESPLKRVDSETPSWVYTSCTAFFCGYMWPIFVSLPSALAALVLSVVEALCHKRPEVVAAVRCIDFSAFFSGVSRLLRLFRYLSWWFLPCSAEVLTVTS